MHSLNANHQLGVQLPKALIDGLVQEKGNSSALAMELRFLTLTYWYCVYIEIRFYTFSSAASSKSFSRARLAWKSALGSPTSSNDSTMTSWSWSMLGSVLVLRRVERLTGVTTTRGVDLPSGGFNLKNEKKYKVQHRLSTTKHNRFKPL